MPVEGTSISNHCRSGWGWLSAYLEAGVIRQVYCFFMRESGISQKCLWEWVGLVKSVFLNRWDCLHKQWVGLVKIVFASGWAWPRVS